MHIGIAEDDPDQLALLSGWLEGVQHSVRGFFAGVVQKKLHLKLNSEQIDGNRIYRIIEATGLNLGSRRQSRSAA